MKSEAVLYKDIRSHFDSIPYWDTTHIAVGVKDGIVVLSGHIKSYAEKKAIIQEIRNLEDVKAVVDELDVSLEGQLSHTDEVLTEMILKAFERNAYIIPDRIRVTVEKGCVTLTGQVESEFQKKRAEEMIGSMEGVRRIINRITVRPFRIIAEETTEAAREDSQIYESILTKLNSLYLDTEDVFVEIREGIVRLDGKVTSLIAKSAIEEEIKKIDGVKAIINELIVAPVKKAKLTDIDIAKTVLETLRWNVLVPFEKIKISVDQGYVTLSGEVDFPFQKREAESSIRNLTGVLGVINEITDKYELNVSEKNTSKQVSNV